MSIPPLVCSTPPPPDQCEDYKDPEDYDLQYNLSQDDESNDFEYGNFATYNHFQSSIPAKDNSEAQISSEIISDETTDTIVKSISEEKSEHESNLGTNIKNESTLRFEEDINLEDLNLEIVQDSGVNNVRSLSSQSSQEPEVDTNEQKTDIPEPSSISDENNINSCNPTLPAVSIQCNDEIINQSEVHSQHRQTLNTDKDQSDKLISDTNISFDSMVDIRNLHITRDLYNENQPNVTKYCASENEVNDEDDFSDFDDFQYESTHKMPVSVINTDSPWKSDEHEESDFCAFEAKFDEKGNQQKIFISSAEESCTKMIENENVNDDFGDFESSELDIKQPYQTEQGVQVFNLSSIDNESQLIESLNSVINSIFDQEIIECVNDTEIKLESLLCETWGYLVDTDIRQPYMVNWNNSWGQKILLRSLCIDSRNILFGPKWSSNMPKYATNLSAAPLQPLKPMPVTKSHGESVNIEKAAGKLADTWTDPFTSDGQEFTYAETLLLDLEHLMATLDQMANNHSSLKISEILSHACNIETENSSKKGRSDPYVFEAPSKSDKIFTNTLNVQPLRHINLPDTHIFTPSDSETPRSKTIHYDSVPAMLMPQNVSEISSSTVTNNDHEPSGKCENDDFSDFDEFKSSSELPRIPSNPASVAECTSKEIRTTEINTPNNLTPKVNTSFHTQILTPIKVEPTFPTLNWPDPGEIKVTYDDFSDFISNSLLNKEENDLSTHNSRSRVKSENLDEKLNTNDVTKVLVHKEFKTNSHVGNDDEFDTFKSALPATDNSTSKSIVESKPCSSNMINNDFCFVSYNELANLPKKDDGSKQYQKPYAAINHDDVIKSQDHNIKSSPSLSLKTQSNILQPTQLNTVTTQIPQQAGQILQPLSLESYSQINWPNPGINLQDLSRFNPVETLQSFKSDLSVSGHSKGCSPVHNSANLTQNQQDDDFWGDYVSSKPKQQQAEHMKSPQAPDDEEWTDFVSSPSVKPQNGLNTISLNVHTNLNSQKSSKLPRYTIGNNQLPVEIPTLSYITPKSNNQHSYTDRYFQNL